MINVSTIARMLDKELGIRKIKDLSINGLQVKSGRYVNKIGLAVDGCISTFKLAKKSGVDFLIVHHGIKWRGQKYKVLAKARESYLKRNRISLYAAHLPLDAHGKYGNNIGLARILKLVNPKRFARYHGSRIGYKGKLARPVSANEIAGILNRSLGTKSVIYPLGKKTCRNIGIVSGGGGEAIEEARPLDCLILGEMPLGAYHRARDYRLSIITAGHYATETVGVKSLKPFLESMYHVPVVFINNKVDI